MTGASENETSDVAENEAKSPSAQDTETNHSHSQDFSLKKPSNVHLKILVPSVAAGAIIGKNGEAITNVQNNTGAKVKMSKANDFYPGTNERVCLIIGTTDAILAVYNYISEKIYEKPDTVLRVTSDGRVPFERHKQVKLLVPNSTAGMIIGKAGSFITEIKNKTGAFIQISQKSKEMSLAERCITIGGELTQTHDTVRLLLTKIAEDPQSTSCPNISYVDVSGPVASAYPTGSPYAIFLGSSSPPAVSHQQAATSTRSFYPQFPRVPSVFTHPLSSNGGCHSPNNAHFDSSATTNGCRTNSTSRRPTTISNSRQHPQADLSSNQSILGAASNSGCGGGIGGWTSSQSNTGPPFRQFGATHNHLNNPSGQNNTVTDMAITVRGVLQRAGYTDEAAEEISQAMRILTMYGFMSMPNLGNGGMTGLQPGCCGPMPNFATSSISPPPPPLQPHVRQPLAGSHDQYNLTMPATGSATGVVRDKPKTMPQSSTSSQNQTLIGSQSKPHAPHQSAPPTTFSSTSPPHVSPHRPPNSPSSFPLPSSDNSTP